MAERETAPQPSPHADRLRICRNIFDIPLRKVADESGLSIPYISQVENGRRALTPDVRRKLHSALAQLIGRAA